MDRDGAPALVTRLAEAAAELAAMRQEVSALRAELRAADARERVLTLELQHRVRNMLAVLRSIYRRTREHGASQEEFAEHFKGRLEVIGRYQANMVGIRPGGIELEDMIRDELLDLHCLDGPQCRIAGPRVILRGAVAELMGLALHELATNAIKFGAFYHGGTLDIGWSVTGDAPQTILRFHWKEAGVPLLSAAPRLRGFGQNLIEEALPYQLNATTVFALQPGGLNCSICIPLPADMPSGGGGMEDTVPGLPSEVE